MVRALILPWLAMSVYASTIADGELFQRAGSLGVASAIVLFAVIWRDLDALGLRMTNAQARWDALRTKVVQLKLQTEQSEAGPVMEEIRKLSAEIEEGDVQATGELVFLNEQQTSVRKKARLLEVSILVISTLQWGFGDMIFPGNLVP